ncbi:hypothetical protein [Pseudomonas serbica]|jgi:hypothetical protein
MYIQKNLSPLVKSLRLNGDHSGNHPGADRISILPMAVVLVLSWTSNGRTQNRIDQLNLKPFLPLANGSYGSNCDHRSF